MTSKTPDAWLAEYLTTDPVPAKEVKAAGLPAGYSARTLQRAMLRIGGVVTGKGPATTWALSVTTTPPVPVQDQGPPPTGPPCPVEGYRWPVREVGPPPHWRCTYCGHRYGWEVTR